MSWSDDMRCLYCDGKLPLYRKITSGQFCSSAHRKAYWQEQERLAVERLHQTHNSLRAYRPPVAPEAILGEALAPPPQGPPEPALKDPAMSGFAPANVPPQHAQPRMIVAGSEASAAEWDHSHPAWDQSAGAYFNLPEAGFSSDFRLIEPRKLPLQGWNAKTKDDSAELEITVAACHPSAHFESAACALPVAARVTAGPYTFVDWEGGRIVTPDSGLLPPLSAHPASRLVLNITPEAVETTEAPAETVPAPVIREQEIPQAANLIPLKRCDARAPQSTAPAAVLTEPIDSTRESAPEIVQWQPAQAGRELAFQTLAALAAPAPAKPAGAAPLKPATEIASQPDLEPSIEIRHPAPPPAASPRIGAGVTYSVSAQNDANSPVLFDSGELLTTPTDVTLPEHIAAVQDEAVRVTPASELCGLQPLSFELNIADGGATLAMPAMSSVPQPLRPSEALPSSSRLEPMDSKPASDYLQQPGSRIGALWAKTQNVNVWASVSGFWNNAPRDLKLLAIAIPALLALAFHPPLPQVHVQAHAPSAEIGQDVKTAVKEQWGTMRQAVFDRAAVALDEDFRSGLDEWASRGDATAAWSFDATGFVRPSALAVYRPSMGLTDYQVQFLGMIDRKALSWVVRAADFDNYYVVKLTVLKPGPLTSLGITRYAVIDGKAQDRADTVVPIAARPDMLYRVRLDLHDDSFALAIQGQMVDTWSEPRLRRGGIGFFSARGEESRVRWVQVTHQYDVLGRLCAYLAPYDIPTPNGSW